MDFDALEQNYQMRKMPTRAGQAPGQPQKKKKNFWLDQISTAGGIVGGIAGLPLGLLGAGGGAAAGSALGETLENILAPGTGDWGNVAEEAALGGVFGAGPIRLLKGAGGAVKGLAGGTASSAAGEAGEQALKTSTRGRMTDAGNKALASQYGAIGKPVARANNPSQTVGQLADMGIFKPKDAERIAGSMTGSNGILNQQVLKAVGDAGIVPTRNVNTVLKDAITANGLVDKDAKSVIQVVKAQMKSLEKTGSRPQEVLSVMKNLEKRAANLQGKGGNYRMSTPERVDQANALLQVRDELQDQLYRVAGANKNLAGVLTPELREQLVTLNPGSPQWKRFIDDTVMKSTDIGQLRSAQAPFVRIGNIINEADMNAFTVGGKMANGMGGGTVGSKMMDVGTQVLRNPAARATGRALRSAGASGSQAMGLPTRRGVATNIGLGANLAGDMINGGGQAEAQGLEDVFSDQMGGEIYPNETPGLPNGISGAFDPNTMEPMEQEQQGSPYTKQNLLADMQRDPQNANKYIAYYQSLAEIFQPEGGAGLELPNTAIARISDYESGIDALDTLGEKIGASNANSPILGNIRRRNPLDNEAGGLNSSIRSVRQLVGKALEGGVLRREDEIKYQEMLPKMGDTDEMARRKIENVRYLLTSNLNSFKQNSQRYSGAGVPQSLEDVYANQQGAYQ